MSGDRLRRLNRKLSHRAVPPGRCRHSGDGSGPQQHDRGTVASELELASQRSTLKLALDDQPVAPSNGGDIRGQPIAVARRNPGRVALRVERVREEHHGRRDVVDDRGKGAASEGRIEMLDRTADCDDVVDVVKRDGIAKAFGLGVDDRDRQCLT